MKNLILALALIMIFAGCNKDNSLKSKVVIKGTISGSTMKSAGLSDANPLSLSDAKQVFVVNIANGQLNSEFIDITNGSFSATSKIGVSTALVFLDADKKYIGTLSSRGLNLLPLNNLTEGGSTTIDLANLTLEGTVVVPSHDPLGNEIIISDAEINRLKALDGFFESLAKNIDADNDNVLDVLNNKQLFIKTRFWIQAKNWGVNTSAPLFSDVDVAHVGYQIELDGASGFGTPGSIVLSGPAGEPYYDISTEFINPNGNGGFYSGISRTGSFFKKGTYNIKIDNSNYTLDYSNNDVSTNLLFVFPTLHLNHDSKLTSITLEYKLPDGTVIDPVNIVTDLMLQLYNDSGAQYFSSPWLMNDDADASGCNCQNGLFTYNFDSPLDISRLTQIIIPYNDLLGNTYYISWNR